MLLPRVVHQDVESAELLDGLVDRLSTEVRIADVAAEKEAAGAVLLDEILGLLGVAVLLEVGDRDVGTLLGEGDRDGATDAAVAAGDEGHAPIELAASAVLLAPFGARLRLHPALDPGLVILLLRGTERLRFL